MKIRRIPIQDLLSGDKLHLNTFYFEGSDPEAPSAYVQASLHGAEIQGNLVIEELLDHFLAHPPLGNIMLVPFCNPIGANRKLGDYTQGRYDPVSGNNWNRCFIDLAPLAHEFAQAKMDASISEIVKKFRTRLVSELESKKSGLTSAAHRLAWQLQRQAADFDHVLDLHCDLESVVYAYAPEYALTDVTRMDISFALATPDTAMGAMEDGFFAPWAALAKALKLSEPEVAQIPRAFTFELGAQEVVSRPAAQKQKAGILNYLAWRGVVKKDGEIKKNAVTYARLKDVLDIPAPHAGLSECLRTLGEKCSKGDPLLQITNLLSFNEDGVWSKAKHVIKAPKDGIPLTTLSSASVLPGTDLLKLMTELRVL